MKKQLHYLSFFVLLLLCGCEVTLHDNYVETQPLPMETPIEIYLDAEQGSTGELLLIEGIKVGYRIHTPESRLLSASFYINDNLVCETYTAQGEFDAYSQKENCIVKCKITTQSLHQGESLRDQVNDGQTYVGEMSWPARLTTPKLTFYQLPEETSLESSTIHWNFNLKNFYFKVIDNGEEIAPRTKETSITLPTPQFGSKRYLEVRIVDEAGNEIFPFSVSGYYYSGPGFSLKGSQMSSLYSAYSNVIYASQYGEVTSFAIPSLTSINEYNGNRTNGTPVAAAPNSGKIAVDYSSQVCIFSGEDLKLVAEINYPENHYAPNNIVLTSDNKLALYYNYLAKVFLYNADNGRLEKTIILPETSLPEEHTPATWSYELNENYLCEPMQHYGFYLSPLQGFEKGQAVFYPQSYNSYFFHPTHPHELVIVSNAKNNVSILNCRNGEIIRTIAKSNDYIFCNIDPMTGNYLFRESSHAVIMDERGEELFRVRCNGSTLYLANNILTCWEGFALNVEPYLKK